MKIDVNSMARRVEVDNRIPLRYYYRIADNLLKQANVYREEKNLVDLYIMLLRYSSLISETIPYHRDYQAVLPKERSLYRKKLLSILDELESIKPEVDRRVKELNERDSRAQLPQLDGPERTSYSSQTYLPFPLDNKKFPSTYLKQPTSTSSQVLRKNNDEYPWGSDNSTQLDRHFQKLAIKLPAPNSETLSRHSFLGPNGLRGQWHAPSAEIKVQYPNSTDLPAIEIPIDSGLNQVERFNDIAVKDDSSVGITSTMDSVLSLDDGRWKNPPSIDDSREDFYQLSNIRQPNPPPVLAQIHQDSCHIHPSKVADPRPGPAKSSQDGSQNYSSFQHLHVPVRLMEDFLRLARANTEKNLETCAILAGSLGFPYHHTNSPEARVNFRFGVSLRTLNEFLSSMKRFICKKLFDTFLDCQTLNEEELFEVQDKLSLFSLGWIHTHPTQTCFMSSVDLHTHYSYQIMLPEAIAIVMAPTDSSCPHGIFHLSDPGGVSVIRNCQERGFHPHEEPSDGTSIYEHCSHVFMNPHIKFEVIDLR